MAAALTSDSKARSKATELHAFLKEELQLPLGNDPTSIKTFAAFMGLMRSCNPLHSTPKAARALRVRCPLVRRFPEVLTGKLAWYKDVQGALEHVVDFRGAGMTEVKMWRMMVWIFLGNGGHLHQAWHALRKTPCCTSYKRGDARQPLEVLRFVIRAVSHTGSLMRVIGSDGLDKKSRLAEARILWLCEWHRAVPGLVQRFAEGAQAFHDALLCLPGLKGELSRKEVLILFASSRYPELAGVGGPLVPFGQGAKNGARAFLGVPMDMGKGVASTRHYHRELSKRIPVLEATMGRLFPALGDTSVTIGDIEPCLCAAFVYTGLVRRLRAALGSCWRTGIVVEDEKATWLAVTKMKGPAGFYPYTWEGVPEAGPGDVTVPALPYSEFQLKEVPSRSFLHKQAMFRVWGVGPRGEKVRRGTSVSGVKRRRVRSDSSPRSRGDRANVDAEPATPQKRKVAEAFAECATPVKSRGPGRRSGLEPDTPAKRVASSCPARATTPSPKPVKKDRAREAAQERRAIARFPAATRAEMGRAPDLWAAFLKFAEGRCKCKAKTSVNYLAYIKKLYAVHGVSLKAMASEEYCGLIRGLPRNRRCHGQFSAAVHAWMAFWAATQRGR